MRNLILNQSPRIRNVLLFSLITSALVLICIHYVKGDSSHFNKSLLYSVIKSKTYDNLNYNSRSPDPNLFSEKEFLELVKSDLRNFFICFDFKTRKTIQDSTIFQTASGNSGIRLELKKPSTLQLVVGSNNRSGSRCIDITSNLELNKWHYIEIRISSDKQLKVLLDKQVLEGRTFPEFNFNITDVCIGSDSSKINPFYGEISNLEVKYSFLDRNALFYIVWTIKIIAVIIFISSVLMLLNRFYYNAKECVSFYKEKILDKEKKVKIIANGIFLGFVLSIFCQFVFYSLILGFSDPWNTPLIPYSNIFTDYIEIVGKISAFNPYFSDGGSNYFPFAYYVFAVFSFFPLILGIVLYLGLFTVLFFAINKYELGSAGLRISGISQKYKNKLTDTSKLSFFRIFNYFFETNFNLIVFTFLSFPVLFLFERGNCENYLFIFLWLFIYFYRENKFQLSALFLSLAICMKLYPAVFIVLFIKQKKYKEIVLVAIYSVLITFTCLLFFKGGFNNNLQYIYSGFSNLKSLGYFVNNNYVQEGVSFYTFIKPILIYFNGFSVINLESYGFKIFYYLICLTVAAFTSLYILLIEKELWKNVFLLTALMLLLPFMSCPYKLIHLYLSLFLFVNSKPDKTDFFYSVIFVMLLIPASYWYMMGIITDGGQGISISVFITPILIIIMMVKIFKDGIIENISNQGISLIKNNLLNYFK